MTDDVGIDLTSLTADVLCAYLSHNALDAEELPDLIRTTYAAFDTITSPATDPSETHVPAVSVRKSLASPHYILSLIDGEPYKTLKRHLAAHGLTPAEYRQRYALPADYPMVALSYAERRRRIAAAKGLGQRANSADQDEQTSANSQPTLDDASSLPEAADLVGNPSPEARVPAAPVKRQRRRGTSSAASASSAVTPTESTSSPAPRRRLKLKLAGDEALSS